MESLGSEVGLGVLGGWVSVGWGVTFCGHGYRVWVWLSGGVVCGGEWLRLGWVFGVLGVVCGVGLVGGCIFLFGVWGVGFAGALGVGCYLCVMSAWGFGGVVCVRGG